MRDKNGRLGNIWVERDHENDMGYYGEFRMSSSLSFCGSEGRQIGEGNGENKIKKGFICN